MYKSKLMSVEKNIVGFCGKIIKGILGGKNDSKTNKDRDSNKLYL